jgi:hypothetical protein
MAILQFLHGKNLKTNNPAFNPGTMYLDTETGELWFDDPSNTLTQHTKVIDTATLLYSIEETFEYPGEGGGSLSGATTAMLGTAILGTMILG